MIDLHTHVLPGVDDGPADLPEALAVLRGCAARGVNTVVATPHVSDAYPTTAKIIFDGARALNAALGVAGVDVLVLRGAEIALERLGALTEEELAALRIGGGSYLLVESPLSPSAGDFEPALHALRERGFDIILAHPERCPAFQRDLSRLVALVAEGVLCSVTASALTGAFGRTARELGLRLLREGLVHNIASDTHDAVRRAPGLSGPLAAAERDLPGLGAQVDWLCTAVPDALITGGRLPAPPPPVRARPESVAPSWRRRRRRAG